MVFIDFYKDNSEIEERHDKSNYDERRRKRPLPIEKNKKVIC